MGEALLAFASPKAALTWAGTFSEVSAVIPALPPRRTFAALARSATVRLLRWFLATLRSAGQLLRRRHLRVEGDVAIRIE